jgi:bacteriocin biosynthesis cyclodehydratase domain-containing protein
VDVAVPTRPLLAPWYRVVADGERLLLEFAQRVVVLEGAAVRALLPTLLPLLDGTHTLEELTARVGSVAGAAVDRALQMLADHGLLTEGPDAPPESRRAAHAVAAAFGLAPTEAATRLGSAVVSVVGSAPTGLEVARLLHAEGIGSVMQDAWVGSVAADLVVVTPAPNEVDALLAWNRHALDVSLRWLPVLPFDGRFSAVGPLVVPDESCCYECLLLRRAANLEYGEDLPEIEATPVATDGGPALERLAAAVAAHLVVRWVIGRDTAIAGVLHAVETMPGPAITGHTVLRVPRCPGCSPAERRPSPLPWHAAKAA